MLHVIYREQFLEAETELKSLEEENVQLKGRLRDMTQSIVEVCGHDCKDDDFDWEGDNDILEINFAGNRITIKRSIFTKPKFGQNFFSSLFQKKWDEFHVRDKSGRIYLDFKEEWVRPLLDYMKGNADDSETTPASYFSGSNYYLVRIMREFKMNKIFKLYPIKSSLPLVGLNNQKVLSKRSLMDHIRSTCLSQSTCLQVDLNKIYFQCSRIESGTDYGPKPDYDIRFKSLLCVIESNDRSTTIVYSNQQRPNLIEATAEDSSSAPTKKKKCCVFADLFPIVSNKLDAPLDYGDLSSCRKLEIYEMKSNYDRIQISDSFAFPVKSLPKIEENTNSFMEKLLTTLKGHHEELKQEKSKLEADLKFLEEERQFMEGYFYKTWNFSSDKVNTVPKHLRDIIARREAFHDHLQNKKRKLTEDPDSLDPIVYFNVEGEIFTILRWTILNLIPGSQLAVRVSGRWEEQPEKGDIDEEGNLLVNCHKESFRQIIAALQVYTASAKLRILVTTQCRDFIEETLDYLLIVPDLLVYID
jgi:hypothetical protein